MHVYNINYVTLYTSWVSGVERKLKFREVHFLHGGAIDLLRYSPI